MQSQWEDPKDVIIRNLQAELAALRAKLDNSLVLEKGRFDAFHAPLIDEGEYLLYADLSSGSFWTMGRWNEEENGWLDHGGEYEHPEGCGGVITDWYGPLPDEAKS